jgi:hypothetical protein
MLEKIGDYMIPGCLDLPKQGHLSPPVLDGA